MKPPRNETAVPAGQDATEFSGAVPLIVEAQAPIPAEGLGRETPQVGLTHALNRQLEAPDGRADVAAMLVDTPTRPQVEIRDSLDPSKEQNPPNNSPGGPVVLPQDSEPRRTLHLPLSQHGGHRSDPQVHETGASDASESAAVQPARGDQQVSLPAPSRQYPDRYAAANSSGTIRTGTEPNKAKEGGAFIDRALRERVDEDIAAFLAAFDAALAADSLQNRIGLREATDRLLRAGARTRIELERLEARMPLSNREGGGHPAPTWRPR